MIKNTILLICKKKQINIFNHLIISYLGVKLLLENGTKTRKLFFIFYSIRAIFLKKFILSYRSMKILKELVKILNEKKVQNVNILELNRDVENRYSKFYKALLNDEVNDDEAGAELLYGKSDGSYVGYQKFKMRFLYRAVNTLFLLEGNLKKTNGRSDLYLSTHRMWAASKMLLGQQSRAAAVMLSLKVLRLSTRYEFFDLAVESSAVLRRHYATIKRNKTKYDYFKSINQIYSEELRIESLADELYEGLIFQFRHKNSAAQKIITLAAEATEQLRPYTSQTKGGRFFLVYYLVQMTKHDAANDYKKMLEVCDEAIDFFTDKKIHAQNALTIFWNRKTQCCIQLRLYKEGEEAIEKIRASLKEGTNSWFNNMELGFRLGLHTAQYQKALSVYVYTTSYIAAHNEIPTEIKEFWQVSEAYLYFLVASGMIDPKITPLPPSLKNFKVRKFRNSVPQFSNDKRGRNISMLIIQVVLMLSERKYNDIVDRMEAIGRYAARHLQKDEQLRTNIFIRMLMIIPFEGFHKAAIIRKTSNHSRKLKAVPMDISEKSFKTEILPYEFLWQMILEMLEDKRRLPRKAYGVPMEKRKV